MSISEELLSISSILTHPVPSDPLVTAIAHALLKDMTKHNYTVRECVQCLATVLQVAGHASSRLPTASHAVGWHGHVPRLFLLSLCVMATGGGTQAPSAKYNSKGRWPSSG